MSLMSIIVIGILIALVLQLLVSIYFIYVLISADDYDDKIIVHEIDFEGLSKEEQEALLKFMEGVIEDD